MAGCRPPAAVGAVYEEASAADKSVAKKLQTQLKNAWLVRVWQRP